jgi:hypothetical protein
VTRARRERIIGQVDTGAFELDGYVVVRGAFGEDTARACRDMIWDVLAGRGVSPEDGSTWAPPLIRINCPEGEPFTVAGTSPGCTPPMTNSSAAAGGVQAAQCVSLQAGRDVPPAGGVSRELCRKPIVRGWC